MSVGKGPVGFFLHPLPPLIWFSSLMAHVWSQEYLTLENSGSSSRSQHSTSSLLTYDSNQPFSHPSDSIPVYLQAPWISLKSQVKASGWEEVD